MTFTMFPLPSGPFDAIELLRDPYVLLVSRSSPLCSARQPLALRALADVPLIGPRMCISGELLESRLRGYGIEPRVIFRSDDNGTVQGLVGAGVGAAILPRLAVDPTDDLTRSLSLDDDVAPRIICLAWHRDRFRTPAARAFVAAAQTVCADLQIEAQQQVAA
jgi:DNA-binding transcriptional LysR family regulator